MERGRPLRAEARQAITLLKRPGTSSLPGALLNPGAGEVVPGRATVALGVRVLPGRKGRRAALARPAP